MTSRFLASGRCNCDRRVLSGCDASAQARTEHFRLTNGGTPVVSVVTRRRRQRDIVSTTLESTSGSGA